MCVYGLTNRILMRLRTWITHLFDASWILGSVESYCRTAIGGRVSSLWSSYRLDKKLFMAALWNRAGHYIFMLWFLSIFFYLSIFFSSPNLSGRRLDVYHTSTHGVALVRIRMQVWNVLRAARIYMMVIGTMCLFPPFWHSLQIS